MRALLAMMMFVSIGAGIAVLKAKAGESEVRQCLKKSLSKQHPFYQISEDLDKTGKYNRYLALICEGESAKNLYLSIKDQTYPGNWGGKTEGTIKYLGDSGGASLCYHITRDSEGERADRYNCSIRLNISSENLGRTPLEGMNPFSLYK
jgi:hypothetical protein